jgi:GNAT superfamily N-acetyltransferase
MPTSATHDMIRLASFNDVPELQQLIAISARGLSNGYYTPAQVESAIRYIFGVDSQLIKDGTYYVFEKDNMIVGCGGWSKRRTLYGGDQHKQTAAPSSDLTPSPDTLHGTTAPQDALLDPTDALLDPTLDAAKIRAFFVHPDYARQGIGSRIMSACEAAAMNAGFTRFELGSTLPGVPLYSAMGYSPIARIDETLPDGEVLGIVRMGKDMHPTSMH